MSVSAIFLHLWPWPLPLKGYFRSTGVLSEWYRTLQHIYKWKKHTMIEINNLICLQLKQKLHFTP